MSVLPPPHQMKSKAARALHKEIENFFKKARVQELSLEPKKYNLFLEELPANKRAACSDRMIFDTQGRVIKAIKE